MERTQLKATAVAHPLESAGLKCRLCGAMLRHSFADLGITPLRQKHVPEVPVYE